MGGLTQRPFSVSSCGVHTHTHFTAIVADTTPQSLGLVGRWVGMRDWDDLRLLTHGLAVFGRVCWCVGGWLGG